MLNNLIAFVLIVVCGCIELGVSVLFYWKHLKKRKACTGITSATCVKMSPVTHHNFEGDYVSQVDHPYLCYSVDGVEYETILSVSSTAARVKVGDQVRLHYDPSNPDVYYLDEDRVTREVYIVFIISGVLTILLGLGLMAFIR